MKQRMAIFVLSLVLFPALALAADSERPDLARLIAERGYVGCFVAQTPGGTIRVNPQRAAQGFRPASTYKVLNAAVALESGVAPDVDFSLPWDGVAREVPAWNQDLTLEQAFRVSAVWYFMEIGRRNGRERLGAAMRAVGYGNADASGSDKFWLDGPLRISADEQVRWLDRLARGDVPFSTRTRELLRKIMLTDQGEDADGQWRLYAKTGLAFHDGSAADRPIAWLVGWVERGGINYPFALNLGDAQATSQPSQGLPAARMELAREMLARLGILPRK